MSTKVLDGQLSQKELEAEIFSFARSKDAGSLGTRGPAGLRVSPVRYFFDDDQNLYVQSRGGSKFTNLDADNGVCLLVASEFQDDDWQIKGVQFFGQGEIIEPGNSQYEKANQYSPWPHDQQAKFIRIHYKRAIYVDRLGQREIKQEWVP